MKIRVLTKRPCCPPRSTWIGNSLENLKKYVGGDVAAVRFAADSFIVSDKDGKSAGKDFNCNICGVDFFGDVILLGVKDDEFADLPMEYKDAKMLLRSLWEEVNDR